MNARTSALALTLFVAVAALGTTERPTAAAPRAPETYLVLAADDDAHVGGAPQRFLTAGTWTVNAYDRNDDGPIDLVQMAYRDEAAGEDWSLTFGAPLGEPLVAKAYPGASWGADETAPALDVGGDGFGCGGEVGAFTVLYADFDTSNGELRVNGFAARFREYCDGVPYALYGVVSYNAPPVPFVTSATYSASKRRLSLTGENLAGARSVTVDGAPASFKTKKSGAVVVTSLSLAEGEHAVVVESADGVRSPELRFPRDPAPDAGVGEPSEFSATGDAGDEILDGRSVSYRGGPWVPFVVRGADGRVESVVFQTSSPSGDERFALSFSTAGLGHELRPGVYDGATKYPLGEPGTPGLNVESGGRICDRITGTFTITNVVFDYRDGLARLLRLDGGFEQHCGGVAPALRGSIAYSAPAVPRVLAAMVFGSSLRLTVADFKPSGQVYVDGKRVDFSVQGKTVVVSAFRASANPHAISLRSSEGLVSTPFVLHRT